MSLIPPDPIILSKVKHLLKSRFADDPEMLEHTYVKLGPFFTFRLKCSFRDMLSGEVKEIDNIPELINGDEKYSKQEVWDCIDSALFMHTRLKKKLTEVTSTRKGVYSIYITAKRDDKPKEEPYSDLYLDEIPVS